MITSNFFWSLLKAVRPRQWLKNLAVFAPIMFTGQLFNPLLLGTSFKAFIILCAISSSNYLFNDVMDAPKDKKHPFKRFRPIASGIISPRLALVFSFGLLFTSLFVASQINTNFLIMCTVFTLLAFGYTLIFKHFAVVDILVIALGYFLRVYTGEAATGWHISVWLALAAFSLSLFLAVGKRRAELTLIQNMKGAAQDTRTTLLNYSEKLLDTYTAMFANSTWITYAFYSFLERPPISKWQYRAFILDTFPSDRKWLMATIPFVLFGIMRYMQLIYEGKGESPEKILTSDIPLLTTILLWVTLTILIIYVIGG